MTGFVIAYAKILDNDLTAPQTYILQTLASVEQRNCTELAEALDVTLPAVTNLANKLARKGYIERTVSKTDRRSVQLRITEKGREMDRRLAEKYKQLTADLWNDFTEPELDLLLASFRKMLRNFQINR
ncbi:MarR family winged helix-turn-helix transcriptional regulator [Paenibacillus hodogayensis]|uniref:MarR family winged helix-turn-helix transcriptional regulator n=1 Tax=Paenibacillus hodogayensis TaxID=279208 RepID=A0ABV5W0V7_9BACL